MKKLFRIADEYLKTCTWKDMALIKFCLISLGAVIGLLLPGGAKKAALILCLVVFAATYVPVMIKFVGFLRKAWHK